eukprot:s491_g23.t1
MDHLCFTCKVWKCRGLGTWWSCASGAGIGAESVACLQKAQTTPRVALERVKCFRAVLLNKNETALRKLMPTNHMWRYLSAQVVVVLDVQDSGMEEGHILVTERPLEAFYRLKGESR